MDVLKLPTDNLYKFLAMAGLFIVAGSVAVVILLIIDIDKKLLVEGRSVTQFEADTKSLGMATAEFSKTVEYLTEKTDRFAQAVDKCKKTLAKGACTKETEEADREARAARNQVDAKQSDLNRVSYAWSKSSAAVAYDKNLVETYVGYFHVINPLSVICIIVGALISLTGFALWYIKVQRFEDLILRKRAESSNSTESQ